MSGEEFQKKRWFRIAVFSCAVLLAAAGVFALFLPLPKRMEAASEESYACSWENGAVTDESYFSACAMFSGATADGIYLNGTEGLGTVLPSQEYRAAFRTLAGGNLGELYALHAQVSRLESVALWCAFGDTVWYDNGYFVWDGARIARSSTVKRKGFVLLNGSVSARSLSATGAKKLSVRSSAEITASAFAGTLIEELTAEEPYAAEGGALYLHTAGGTRLVAGVPAARSLSVGAIEWADEGALSPCTQLEELTLPFVGSTRYTLASEYAGEFAWLFLQHGEYRVPESLKRITVTGGTIAPFAFYGCGHVEEITACGLGAEDVAREAFINCTGWRSVHSPNAEIALVGEYTRTPLLCGCTLFERKA